MPTIRLAFVVLTAALASIDAHAVVRTWPGVAPCAGTLQACVAASAAADTVQIVTNTPIDENVFLSRSITLEGHIGFSAQMAAGRAIYGNSTDDGSYNLTIRRIALTNGMIEFTHNRAGAANIEIRRVSMVSTAPTSASGIRIHAGSAGTAHVRIADNRLKVAVPALFDAAMQVTFFGSNGSALIDFNRIESVGDAGGWGILADAVSGSAANVIVVNNELRGRYARAAIGISEGLFSSTPSSVTARVIGNAMVGRSRQGAGSLFVINNGSINAQVVNNTAVELLYGISFSRWSGSSGTGSIGGPVTNNLIARNDRGLQINPEFQPSVVENYNLIFGNDANTYTPGANDVTGDPLLISSTDVRLRAGSPAINAAAGFDTFSAYTNAGLGMVDADGLRRFKDTQADMGAYEYGDFSLRARANAPTANTFVVDHASINNAPLSRLFATVNAGPTDDPPLTTNANPFGVYYFSGRWRMFNQETDAAFALGVEFNVFVPSDGNGAFVHTATAGNLSGHFTTINNSALNNLPSRIVLATPNWNPGGSAGVYNPHTTSVGYFGSSWFVLNNDFADIPVGAAFNIYAQDPSPNAYVHTASSANAYAVGGTILDHPLLNGTRCAQFYVTPRTGLHGDATFDVFYTDLTQRWVIFNHGAVAMTEFAEFNIVIDAAQVAACHGVMFADGFED